MIGNQNRKTKGKTGSKETGQHIIVCGKKQEVGTPVILWNGRGGFACPNIRGRKMCRQHNPALNDQPTRAPGAYRFKDADKAYQGLKESVHQLILHYDVCYTSHHCHKVIKESSFKGSHFYLDLDGTLYQTCDLYWKTNTAPADDGLGNERSIHIEMANLSWQALSAESDLYHAPHDLYKKTARGWELQLPKTWRNKIRIPDFKPVASRAWGKRGFFSRRINGRRVRMWDFTEEQYQALIKLCVGINQILPRIKIQVPFDKKTRRVPLGKISNFASFSGILGHAHIQSGTENGIKRKYDPGSAFDWGRLRRSIQKGLLKPSNKRN